MKQDLNFYSVAEVATFPMIVADPAGNVLYQNPAAVSLLHDGNSDWLIDACRQLTDQEQAEGGSILVKLRLSSRQLVLMEAAFARCSSDGQELFFFFLIDQREKEAILKKLSGERDRLQIMADQLVHAQETERRHLARELHDGLLQYIIGATMYIDKVRSGGEASLLETAVSRLESATLEGRRLIGELRPPTLDHFGLVATIGELMRRVASESGLTVQTRIEIEESELPDALKSNLFRLVQEATNNMVRHSQATKAELKIWKDDAGLRMCLHDNGKGFDEGYTRGIGLASMEERASLFGGRFWIESSPGDTSVQVSIPWVHFKQMPSSEARKTDEIAPFYFSRLRHQVKAQLKSPESVFFDSPPLVGENLNELLHELQVYRIELEMQNEELRRGRTELECERDRYQELFEHAPVGYLLLNPDYRVCQANLAACELFQTDRDGLVGKSLESLVCQWNGDVLQPLLLVGSGQKDVWIRQSVSQAQVRVRLELREGFNGKQSTKLASIYNLQHRPDQPMGGAELEQQVSRLRDGLAHSLSSETPGEIDLNTEIALLYDSLRELTGDNLRVLQGPSLPKVLIDVGSLRLVITNLIKNAAESGGKNITLASGHFVSEHKDPQPFVSLDVSDTGFGGSIDLMNDLFKTFSAGNEACDLRLLETFYLVRRRNGEVRILSEPGRGTTVRILLPCMPRDEKELAP